jgi:hypothetical protein
MKKALFLLALFLVMLAPLAIAQTATEAPAPLIPVLVVMGLQLLLPLFFKSKLGDTARKFIPAGNLVVSLLTQFWTLFAGAAAATPATAPAMAAMASAGPIVYCGLFATLKDNVVSAVANALIQTFLVTGAHGTTKNTAEGVKKLATK